MTISATPAALFRLVSMGPITILFDEVDMIFNPKNGGNNEDLRGLLNAGYKRSATIARCVGDAKNIKVERFAVYAPAALAGIAGAMPTTITTRAITIHMRRRRTDEPVEPFRERQVARQAQPLREQLAAWIDSTGTQLGDAQPDMPDGVTDRPAEIWEPLLAIADTAGGHWPTTARNACRHFVLDTGPQITSTGVRLLADLRNVFTSHCYRPHDYRRHTHRAARAGRIRLGRPAREASRRTPAGPRTGQIRCQIQRHQGHRPRPQGLPRRRGRRPLRRMEPVPATNRDNRDQRDPQLKAVADTNQVAVATATHPAAPDQSVADATATVEVTATHLASQVAAVAAVADMTNLEGEVR